MTYRCYICGKDVDEIEHQWSLKFEDWWSEKDHKGLMWFSDKYLVHCQGPEDNFDSEGRVVVCKNCLWDAYIKKSPDKPKLVDI